MSKEEIIAARKRALDAGGPVRGNRTGRILTAPEFMKLYDTNGDGRVVVAEVPPDLQARIREADANRDGAVTLDELQAFGVRTAPRIPPRAR